MGQTLTTGRLITGALEDIINDFDKEVHEFLDNPQKQIGDARTALLEKRADINELVQSTIGSLTPEEQAVYINLVNPEGFIKTSREIAELAQKNGVLPDQADFLQGLKLTERLLDHTMTLIDRQIAPRDANDPSSDAVLSLAAPAQAGPR